MPNINLTDARNRDAVVKAESVRQTGDTRYVGPKGLNAWTRRVLKATVDHDYEALLDKAGDPEKIADLLIQQDTEVDLESFGRSMWNMSRVFVNNEEEVVYRVEQTEVVRGPKGKVRSKRPRKRAEANVDDDIPLVWTGRFMDKTEAVQRFVFVSKLQIVHINGLTYDFLFKIAKELHDAKSLMLLGAGSKGRDPLIFRRGSVPYRGFLEGRIEGEKYILLLHLSNLELKRPKGEVDEEETVAQRKAVDRKGKAAPSEETDAGV